MTPGKGIYLLKDCFKAAPSISPNGEEMEKIEASIATNFKTANYQVLLLKEKGRDEVKEGLTTDKIFIINKIKLPFSGWRHE